MLPKKGDQALFGVFQPTLLVAEQSGLGFAAAQRMSKLLLHSQVVPYSKAKAPNFLDKRLGELIVDFFKGRRWRGHRKGFGISRRIPQVTQPAGGFLMWDGKREDTSPLSQEELSRSRKRAQAASMEATKASSAAAMTAVAGTKPAPSCAGRAPAAASSAGQTSDRPAPSQRSAQPSDRSSQSTNRTMRSAIDGGAFAAVASAAAGGRTSAAATVGGATAASGGDDVLMPLPSRQVLQDRQRGGTSAFAFMPVATSTAAMSASVSASVAAAMAAMHGGGSAAAAAAALAAGTGGAQRPASAALVQRTREAVERIGAPAAARPASAGDAPAAATPIVVMATPVVSVEATLVGDAPAADEASSQPQLAHRGERKSTLRHPTPTVIATSASIVEAAPGAAPAAAAPAPAGESTFVSRMRDTLETIQPTKPTTTASSKEEESVRL